MLDLWLMVVMCTWLFDIALSAALNAGRFDLGFYAGRLYGLLAASFVLAVLLLENGLLHARLSTAHAEERQRAADLEQASARDSSRSTRSWAIRTSCCRSRLTTKPNSPPTCRTNCAPR